MRRREDRRTPGICAGASVVAAWAWVVGGLNYKTEVWIESADVVTFSIAFYFACPLASVTSVSWTIASISILISASLSCCCSLTMADKCDTPRRSIANCSGTC